MDMSGLLSMLKWFGSIFPVFNVADSCICVGVGLYMVASLALPQREGR